MIYNSYAKIYILKKINKPINEQMNNGVIKQTKINLNKQINRENTHLNHKQIFSG